MFARMAANPGFYPDPVPETRRYVVKPDDRRKGAWRVYDTESMSVIASRWFAAVIGRVTTSCALG